MRIATRCLGILLLAFGLLASTGCVEKEGPAERAGKKIDNALDKAGDKIEKAGDKIEDAAEKVEKKIDGGT